MFENPIDTAKKDFVKYLDNLGLTQASHKNYRSDLNHFTGWLILRVRSFGSYIETLTEGLPFLNKDLAAEYKSFLAKNNIPAKTINRRLSTLRHLAKFMNRANLMEQNFMEGIENMGGSITPKNIPGPVVTGFQSYLEEEKVSKSTVKNYISDVRHFISRVPGLSGLTEDLIKDYQAKVSTDFSPATAKRKVISVGKFLNWAKTKGMVDTTLPAKQISAKFAGKVFGKSKFQHWYKGYRTMPGVLYLNIIVGLLLASALGLGIYNQFIKNAVNPLAATSLVAPSRYLSFQGRLTSQYLNPITAVTNTVFTLYDAASAGTTLWTSGTCSISPDTDGVFSTLLGSTCGSAIPKTVFSDNAAVWLGVTVGTDAEATPRIQIATVAYALNSETLQGYPASSSATINTIPVINNSGQMVLAASSPKIQSTSGTFAIEGQAVTIDTPSASNGSITISPDGTGSAQFIFNGASPGTGTGMLSATDANLTSGALIYGSVASNATGYNLLQLQAGSTPVNKFAIDSAGNSSQSGTLTFGGTATIQSTADRALTLGGSTTGNIVLSALNDVAGGNIAPNVTNVTDLGTSSKLFRNIYGTNIYQGTNQVCDAGGAILGCGGVNYWGQALGALYPVNNTVDLLIGANSTTSAKFAFTNVLTGTPNASIAGTLSLSPIVQGTAGTCNAGSAGKQYYDGPAQAYYYCNGTTWTQIGSGSGVNYWQLNSPVLSPANTSYDLAIGGTSTAAAKFQVFASTGNLTTTGTLTMPFGNILTGVSSFLQASAGISVGGASTYYFNSSGSLNANVGQFGGTSPTSYSRFGTAATTHGLSSAQDVLIGGAAEVNGVLYLNGRNIASANGTSTITFPTDPTASNSYNALSNGSWLVQNNANNGIAALMVDQTKSGDVLSASSSGTPVFTIQKSGNIVSSTGNLSSQIANSATAVAFNLNSTNTLSTQGSKLLSVQNNGTEKFYIDSSGNLYTSGSIISGNGMGILMTNKSGGTVAKRSLVVLDGTNNSSFTTTTTPYSKAVFGVITGVGLGNTNDANGDGNCDANDVCMVATGGEVDVTVKNATTASRNDYLFTSDTAGSAVASAKQFDGLIGVVSNTTNAASGYLKMIFKVQPQVTASAAIDKGSKHNEYWLYANSYSAVNQGSDTSANLLARGLMFDNFYDTTKTDSANTTVSGPTQFSKGSSLSGQGGPFSNPASPYRAGLMGGQTLSTGTTDNAGNTYLGSNTVNKVFYYDRTRDSAAQVQVELGIDPNWYNGVTLAVATTSAQFSQNDTITKPNPNLSTTYNGSLLKVTGNYASNAKTIYVTIKSPTTFDWTDYNGNAVTTVTITPGTAQTLGGTGVSVTFTNVNYNTGDVFKIASWFTEPTGATRGAKQQFPERSNLVATDVGLDIIDADTQKLWMRFTGAGSALGSSSILLSNSYNKSSVTALNGNIYVGQQNTAGLVGVRFNSDSTNLWGASNYYQYNFGISQRNASSGYSVVNTSNVIVSSTVNDVSAAVIPNQPTQNMTVSGWGYIQGASAANASETVNLPYKFNQNPIIKISNGSSRTSAPSSIADCTTNTGNLRIDWRAIATSTSTFTAIEEITDAADGNMGTTYNCYTWTATGQVSPRQYVAAATSGGTSLINETDGTRVNSADTGTMTNVAFAGNTLYAAKSGTVDIYYGPPAVAASYAANKTLTTATIPSLPPSTTTISSLTATAGTSTIDGKSNTVYIGTTQGALVYQEAQGNANLTEGSVEATGSVKYYTKDYISEEMVGNIQGMWGFNSALTDSSVKAATITAGGATITYPSGVRGKGINITAANGTATVTTVAANYSMGIWVKETTGWTYYVKTDAGTYINGVLSSTAFTNRMTWATTTVTLVAGTQDVDEMFATNTTLTPGQIKHMYEVGYRALQSHATTLGGGGADLNQQLGFISTGTNVVGDAKPDYNNQFMYVGTNSTTLGAVSKIDLNSDTNIKTYNSSANVPAGGPLLIDEDVNTLGVGYNLETVGSAASGVKTMGVDNNATATSGNFVSKTVTTAESFTQAYIWTQYVLDASDASNTIQAWASNDGGSNYYQCNLTNTDTSQTPTEYEYFCQFNTPGSSLKTKFVMARGSTKTNTYITRYGIAWIGSDAIAGAPGGNGLYTNTNASVASGSYIDVAHNQNTADLLMNGWIYNTGTSKWEAIDNTQTDATGGTITYTDSSGLNPRSSAPYPGGYTVHTFTATGSANFTPNGPGNVEILVVGGGGGGGQVGSQGGGGGAGGLVYKSSYAVTAGSKTVTVGAGGAVDTNGNNSVFDTLTAVGGGKGAAAGSTTPGNGGSGGGAPGNVVSVGGTGTQPSQSGDSGTYGFGNNGGSGSNNLGYGGGGGGAGAVGSSGNPSTGGAGKDYSTSFGTSVGVNGVFARGGDGVTPTHSGASGPGAANTGNGGAGDWNSGDNSRVGGSGVVIIRYLTNSLSNFKIIQQDANTVRLYNYSGVAQNLRLDVITGGLGRNSGTVSLAPAAADVNANANTNSIWINNTAAGGSLLKLQQSGTDVLNLSQNGGNAAAILNQTLGGDILSASASGTPKFTVTNGGNIDLSGIVFSSGGPKYFPVMYEGQAQTNDTFFNGFTFGKNVTITGITISAKTAPTGSNLTIDILKNGSAQSNLATLTAGSNSQNTTLTPAVYSATDTFGLKVTGVGSTEAGRDLAVIVHYQDAAGGDQVNYISVPYEATAMNGDTILDGLYLDSPITIKKVSISARNAPTGSNLTVDLTKNGSVQSLTANLTAGSTFETTDITDTSFGRGDRLGLKVTGVGSTVAGASLQVIIQFTHDQGDTGTQYLPILYYGLAQNSDDIVGGLVPDAKTTVAKANIFVRTAPTGSNLTVDLTKNGTVESRTMTLHNGYTYQTTNTTDDAYTTGDQIGIRITGVGSTFVGESVMTILHTANASTLASSIMSALEGPVMIGNGDYNNLSGFTPADGNLYVSGALGVSGVAYLEGGTAWTSADLAEAYPTLDPTIEAADVVSISPQASSGAQLVEKSHTAYDTKMLGIISTKPAGVMGVEKIPTGDRKVPVALSGRVPVKIASDSAAISAGDFLTSSDTHPGMAMKATQAGQVVAKALEAWSCHPGGSTATDRISSDSIASLQNDTCDKSTIEAFVNLSYFDPDIYLANIDNLRISATQSGLTLKDTIGNVQGTSLYMSDASASAKAVYQLQDAAGNVIQKVGAFSQFVAANIKSGAIETQDLATNSFTAFQGTVDNLIAKNFQTALISPIPGGTDVTVQIGSTATPSGQFVIQNASGSAVVAIDSSGNATFSGIVRSQNIDEIQALLTKVTADQALLTQASGWNTNTATGSAQLGQLVLSDLFVTNQAAINSLSVSTTLSVGNDLVIQASGIDTLSAPLRIQSLAMAPIELMAGLVTIDTHGNMQIAGNLAVGGNLDVAGKIHSSGLTLKDTIGNVQGTSLYMSDATASASLLSLQNQSGTQVAGVNASGSASFSNLTTGGLTIASDTSASSSAAINGVITTNATAGSATIPSGVSEITIKNPKVTDYTLVYVTPTSSTQNNVLYVKSKQAGQFVVGFSTAISVDTSFNWWVVQVSP